MNVVIRRVSVALQVATAAAGLAACSGDVNPVRDAFVATGVGTQPKPAPDFIERTRPARIDYIPVGTSAPPRPTGAKSKEQVQDTEAQLERARAANEADAQAARRLGTATTAPKPATNAPVSP